MYIEDQMGLSRAGNWYKGNLHSHSTNSDGAYHPQQVVKIYREQGYHFLCLSEHDLYTDYETKFNQEDFIVLPGLEASAELFDEKGSPNRKKVHHVHGILGTTQMVADSHQVPYHHGERHCVDTYYGAWDGLHAAQKLVDDMTSRGMLSTYNHPLWSRVEMEEVIGLEKLWAVEIYNYGTDLESATGYDETFWDAMLRRGKRVFAFASDDNHNGALADSFGGFVMVNASCLSREAIITSLLQGNYYSSNGPQIYEWGIHKNQAYVVCSPANRIDFIVGNKVGDGLSCFAHESEGGLQRATYPLKGHETYIRVKCSDQNGKTAWSNPLFL